MVYPTLEIIRNFHPHPQLCAASNKEKKKKKGKVSECATLCPALIKQLRCGKEMRSTCVLCNNLTTLFFLSEPWKVHVLWMFKHLFFFLSSNGKKTTHAKLCHPLKCEGILLQTQKDSFLLVNRLCLISLQQFDVQHFPKCIATVELVVLFKNVLENTYTSNVFSLVFVTTNNWINFLSPFGGESCLYDMNHCFVVFISS